MNKQIDMSLSEENQALVKEKVEIKILTKLKGGYREYNIGDIIETNMLALKNNIIIEGFKDYVYMTESCYEIIETENE